MVVLVFVLVLVLVLVVVLVVGGGGGDGGTDERAEDEGAAGIEFDWTGTGADTGAVIYASVRCRANGADTDPDTEAFEDDVRRDLRTPPAVSDGPFDWAGFLPRLDRGGGEGSKLDAGVEVNVGLVVDLAAFRRRPVEVVGWLISACLRLRPLKDVDDEVELVEEVEADGPGADGVGSACAWARSRVSMLAVEGVRFGLVTGGVKAIGIGIKG